MSLSVGEGFGGVPAGAGAASDAVWARLAERVTGWLPALVFAYAVLIWPLLFAVPESARSPFAPPPAEMGSNILNQLLFPCLFLVALVPALFVPRERFRLFRHPALVMLGLALAWAAATTLWSVDPSTTIRRIVVQVFVLGAIILPVMLARDPAAIIDRLFAVAAVAVMLNLAVVATTAAGPIGHEGIYTQKNTLGAVAAFGLLLALHRIVVGGTFGRLAGLAVLGATLALLVASRSKTSLGLALAAPFLALGLLGVARTFHLSAGLVAVVGVATAVGIYHVGAQMQLWDFVALSEALVGDPTFTARTDIWNFALAMIERRPLLGFGYEAFWANGFESPAVREGPGFVSRMPHAHNGYIDLMLQAGLVGLVIFLAALVAALHAAASRAVPTAQAFFLLAVMVMAAAHNLLETTWLQSYGAMWMLFVTAVALAARYRHDRA